MYTNKVFLKRNKDGSVSIMSVMVGDEEENYNSYVEQRITISMVSSESLCFSDDDRDSVYICKDLIPLVIPALENILNGK